MSRTNKWKLEKTKVKVVFRLQFHATQIPQSGWDKLFVSSIPVDSTKATAKTMKTNVRNGTCKWADPIYETTRLLQDIRTKEFDAKLYKLVVATGSSRSSVLGEATIDLADYADALKPLAVSLPLQGCASGATLHVTVQLLTSKTGFREFQQQRELSERGLLTIQNRLDPQAIPSSLEENNNGRVERLYVDEEDGGLKLNRTSAEAVVLVGDSSNTSECAYTEMNKSTASSDLARSCIIDCVDSRASDDSMDNDLAAAREENDRLRACLEVAESSILELKTEVNLLRSHADELGFESQKLAEQIADDIDSGKKLAQEVSVLKSECLKLKDELARRTNHIFVNGSGQDAKLQQSELAATDYIEATDLASQETDLANETNGSNDNIFELLSELDRSNSERESLLKKMSQMEHYYESLIQELEDNRNLMFEELQSLRTKLSTKAEMEEIHRGLKAQIATLSEENDYLNSLNKELERRAISAESILKNGRLNYSIAVEKLQKDLELLSSQVLSMSETNEKLIRLTFIDFSQQCHEEQLHEFDSRVNASKHIQFQHQHSTFKKPDLECNILFDEMKRSLHLQEEVYRKIEGEVWELHSMNVHLDVFSKVLQETLLEANEKTIDLTQLVELSMQKLRAATDDVRNLEAKKAICIAKYNDTALENQNLKASAHEITSPNNLLLKKINGLETLMQEYQIYKNKYESCTVEKAELASLLEIETSESSSLQEKIVRLTEEKKDLVLERDAAQASIASAKSEITLLKQKFRHEMHNVAGKLDESNSLAEKLQLGFESLATHLQASSDIEEKFLLEQNELLSSLNDLEVELQELIATNAETTVEDATTEYGELMDQLCEKNDESSRLASELSSTKDRLKLHHEQNKALIASIDAKSQENAQLASELRILKESFQSLQTESHALMSLSESKSAEACELSMELKSTKEQMQNLRNENQVLVASSQEKRDELSKLALEMKSLKESYRSLYDEKEALQASSQGTNQESSCLASDLKSLKKSLRFLQDRNIVLTESLHDKESEVASLASEVAVLKQNLLSLQKDNQELASRSVKKSEESVKQAEERNGLTARLRSLCDENEDLLSSSRDRAEEHTQLKSELDSLKERLQSLNDELRGERNLRYTLEHTLNNLTSKASEDASVISCLETQLFEARGLLIASDIKYVFTRAQYEQVEVNTLQEQCAELSRRLSEQNMKTEEFRNLSIHFKELKDKAEAQNIEARRPAVPQESLRIAFIKEQYETKLQDLKYQLAMSKKHSEEILWKLQDAIGDIENRRKSEASYTKRNEELANRIEELEAQLQSLLCEKREKTNAYDLMKAEKECSLISLECCKEEKHKLEASLQELKDENSKLEVELANVKELQKISGHHDSVSVNSHQDNLIVTMDQSLECFENDCSKDDDLKAESFRSSLDHLNNELERMKNENLLMQDDDYFTQKFPGLQSELTQLQKANEELANRFPSFNKLSGSGNSLERVLALELELAEALQAKRSSSSIHFQSSFLKQHSHEQAVLKSFKDINDLIEDMLELKRRYAGVETELAEMHNRYSQLSLQFAEVEGERQKLTMTLKNVSASKKAFRFFLSSSPTSSGEQVS